VLKEINLQNINFIKLKFLLKFYSCALECKKKKNFVKALFWNRIAMFLEPKWVDLWLLQMGLYLAQRSYIKAAELYYKSIKFSPHYSTVHRLGAIIAEDATLNDPFHTAFVEQIEIQKLKEMVQVLRKSDPIYHPSRFWLYHLVFNAIQIKISGFENFKRTVNKNYFGWSSPDDIKTQFNCAMKELNFDQYDLESEFENIDIPENQMNEDLSEEEWILYVKLIHLLDKCAKKYDPENIYNNVEEPGLGNPICIDIGGRRVSQDLPHTSIEINTFMPYIKKESKKNLCVAELGAGCGRIGSILLNVYDDLKYTIIDIPPALFVSQMYLSELFPNKKVFYAKEFNDWYEIEEDFTEADIRFLYPQQLELVPESYFNIFINISSMSEMSFEQINNWFPLIDRCTKGIFYFKQYKENFNSFDNVVITKDCYPRPHDWEILLDQENKLFSPFFDLVYKIN
jgi:putative sugar O-methyltransferase